MTIVSARIFCQLLFRARVKVRIKAAKPLKPKCRITRGSRNQIATTLGLKAVTLYARSFIPTCCSSFIAHAKRALRPTGFKPRACALKHKRECNVCQGTYCTKYFVCKMPPSAIFMLSTYSNMVSCTCNGISKF